MGSQLQGNGYEVVIPVVDDRVLEAQESFQGRLQLTPQSVNLRVINLGQSSGEINIVDNDGESLILCTGYYMYMYIHVDQFHKRLSLVIYIYIFKVTYILKFLLHMQFHNQL